MKHRIPAANEPVSNTYLQALDDLDRLAARLDYQFRLPLTPVRLGWDPIIGLVPIAGDLAALALSLRVIASARALGASPQAIRRMIYNVALDSVVGAIPIAGTVFDVFFKANLRNVQLLMDEIRTTRGLHA
jgi:hypothetical protein